MTESNQYKREGCGIMNDKNFLEKEKERLNLQASNQDTELNNSPIDSFRYKYMCFSNFSSHEVTYKGITYKNSEAAFQAQKFKDENVKRLFKSLDPSKAKALGRAKIIFLNPEGEYYKNKLPSGIGQRSNEFIKHTMKSDWDKIRVEEMYQIVKNKYEQNQDIKEVLLSTGERELIEGNTWGDKFWGKVAGVGSNFLGRILMQIRYELRNQ